MVKVCFAPFPQFETQRLLLRQLSSEDTNQVLKLRSDQEVAKFMARPAMGSLVEAKDYVSRMNKGIENNESILWAIVPKNIGKFVGSVCLWNFCSEKSLADLGYELLPESQGLGLMQEAVIEVIKFGFDSMRLQTIQAYTHPQNLRSVKLLKRNGFIKKGHMRDYHPPEHVINRDIYNLQKPR